MIPYKELLKTKEYWTEVLDNLCLSPKKNRKENIEQIVQKILESQNLSNEEIMSKIFDSIEVGEYAKGYVDGWFEAIDYFHSVDVSKKANNFYCKTYNEDEFAMPETKCQNQCQKCFNADKKMKNDTI